MNIIPAIDLINGKCVRLEKGDFDSVKEYAGSALEVAQSYEAAGAEYLHIVDLDGAKNKALSQSNLIGDICRATKLIVQVGGGVRSLKDVEYLLELGVNRIVIGSLAVKNNAVTKAIISKYGADNIVLALDVNIDAQGAPNIATDGWQTGGDVTLWDAVAIYQDYGLKHVLCTDIVRDGMLEGPSLNLYAECIKKFPSIQWQASGGVSVLGDLNELLKIGASGVIIGKALYEERFRLSEALNVVKSITC
ncbi:1-(5-phosphoribosyl)-5-[(5-phosphoribosylamino)methylideneamino]imidazole-4-carboxamide isomerase [Francisellaceae bacterium]|nr:1-(5-phosphoribosyl)-5-[(5-phosphoribosylamino)methylideneamino]imidazole-4-carboxamide isomerase [Francisellaceae bacterium]